MKSQRPHTSHQRPVVPFLAAVALLACPAANAASYSDTVKADNPSAYYRLEETSGSTAFDASVNAVNATYLYNSANTSPQLGLPGIDTNSILFNGGGYSTDVGILDIPASGLITPLAADSVHGAPFSAELWVQPTAQPATYSVPIEVAQFPNGWNIYVSGADANGGTSYFYLNMPNGVLFQGEPDFPISFLHWYHLVVTYDGASAMFYINGVAHGPYAVNYAPAIGSDAHVGEGPGVGWTAFIGGVDEVAFYTNVLTLSQITNHYQIGTNSFRSALLPPTILSDPASATNYSGLPVSFTVSANGTLPLHYQWLKNGAPFGSDATPLTFTSHYPADDGATIQVIVTNSVNSVTSAVATLTVLTNLNTHRASGLHPAQRGELRRFSCHRQWRGAHYLSVVKEHRWRNQLSADTRRHQRHTVAVECPTDRQRQHVFSPRLQPLRL